MPSTDQDYNFLKHAESHQIQSLASVVIGCVAGRHLVVMSLLLTVDSPAIDCILLGIIACQFAEWLSRYCHKGDARVRIFVVSDSKRESAVWLNSMQCFLMFISLGHTAICLCFQSTILVIGYGDYRYLLDGKWFKLLVLVELLMVQPIEASLQHLFLRLIS
jgi:hypothetical protein